MVVCVLSNTIFAAVPDNSPVNSQPQNLSTSEFLPSDPIVSMAFFDFQQAMVRESERRQSLNHDEGERFLHASMTVLGVDASDFAIISATALRVNTQLRKVTEERNQMLHSASKLGQSLSLKRLQEIDQRSQHLIVSGMIDLEHALSPHGNASLQKYIREEFVKHISSWRM